MPCGKVDSLDSIKIGPRTAPQLMQEKLVGPLRRLGDDGIDELWLFRAQFNYALELGEDGVPVPIFDEVVNA
jgi:hypothetical protein